MKRGPGARLEPGEVRCEGGPYWRYRPAGDGVPAFVRFRPQDLVWPGEAGHWYVKRYDDDGTPYLLWTPV
jgi:hypothetical protein